MIRKFVTVPAFGVVLAAILAGATSVCAQQPPSQQPSSQTPASQSGSQEATPEDIGTGRKVKPKDYKKWTFNVGGGGSLTNGTTVKFARSGAVAAAGVARNYSKYFGLRVDFQWDNLPLRNSALQLAQAPGATSQVYSFTFDPIINIPVNQTWGGYFVIGPGYYHRTGKLNSSSVVPGSACNEFWNWWGTCFNGSIPLNKQFLSASENELGLNFGGGITRRITPRLELYGEFRYLHGSGSGRTTDLRPITIGVRW